MNIIKLLEKRTKFTNLEILEDHSNDGFWVVGAEAPIAPYRVVLEITELNNRFDIRINEANVNIPLFK